MTESKRKVVGYAQWSAEVLQFMKKADLTKKQAVATVATIHQCEADTLLRATNKLLQRKQDHIIELGPDDPVPKGYFALEGLFKNQSVTSHLRGQGVFSGEFGVCRKRRSKNDGLGKYYVHADATASYVARRFPHLAPTVIGAEPTPPKQQKLPEIPKEIEQEARRDVAAARNHVVDLLTRIAVSNEQILDTMEELLGCWVGNAKPVGGVQ